MAAAVTEAESASIVLVGSFNPAILHPQWFAKHGLIPEGEAEAAQVAVVSPSLTVVQFTWFTLQVTDKWFTATTTDPSQYRALEECVSGTFALLEFTPIVAMGLNSERGTSMPLCPYRRHGPLMDTNSAAPTPRRFGTRRKSEHFCRPA